jgi:hypothetical protein
MGVDGLAIHLRLALSKEEVPKHGFKGRVISSGARHVHH